MKKQDLIEILEMILVALKESKKPEEEDLRPSDLGGSGGIPHNWTPDKTHAALARKRKVSLHGCEQAFRKWARENGKVIADVDARFTEWLAWEKTKPAAADAKAPEQMDLHAGYVPTETEFDRGAALFAQNQSHWGSWLGPEPGMMGCKCPEAILRQHGIDPATGLVSKP